VKVTAHVLFHTIVPGKTTANGAKSKSKPKEKKDTKAKDFQHSFKGTLENYITLLATILAKHGEEKYNVMEKMIFGIKVQLPSVEYNIEQCTVYFSDQACRKGDAVDIDTFEEYKELVVDILESLPTKMNIYTAKVPTGCQRLACSCGGHLLRNLAASGHHVADSCVSQAFFTVTSTCPASFRNIASKSEFQAE
jgi:hypothetical protein